MRVPHAALHDTIVNRRPVSAIIERDREGERRREREREGESGWKRERGRERHWADVRRVDWRRYLMNRQ